ncbi:hypothetical protein GWI33_003203 [Rhynchophorus ferrugineus]|uniref:Secreted protein n=1 Tax=Rhynchophorus ferrugineus TaxID=354439 RepID=A0A834IXE6_RHYFE|nr:hypothetical protein GWI33_003203 [Rhynchophorus ferrugineus]
MAVPWEDKQICIVFSLWLCSSFSSLVARAWPQGETTAKGAANPAADAARILRSGAHNSTAAIKAPD